MCAHFPSMDIHLIAARCQVRTCWLIRTMAMSFLSLVNWSKASSIAASSVLLSTTR